MAFSAAEKSRRRSERRLIGLLAQNPVLALARSDALATTQWHDALNGRMAQLMLDALAKDPAVLPAALISTIANEVPQAASALTAAQGTEGANVADIVAFLAEELEIGDIEDSVAAMNAQLRDEASLDPQERDIIFHALVDLQKTLAAKRAAHKPVI